MTIYGYARVSTSGQTLAAQEMQLRAVGCDKIFSEKISGAADDRPELNKVLAELQDEDIFIVTRLDRLARSTRNLLNILDTISKAGAGFRSLADEWANTTTPHGRLMLTILVPDGGPLVGGLGNVELVAKYSLIEAGEQRVVNVYRRKRTYAVH